MSLPELPKGGKSRLFDATSFWSYLWKLVKTSFHGAFRVLEILEVSVAVLIGSVGYFQPEWKEGLEVLFLVIVAAFLLTFFCGLIVTAHILDSDKGKAILVLNDRMAATTEKEITGGVRLSDSLQQAAIIFRAEGQKFFHHDENAPHLMFHFLLANTSVHALRIKSATGHARFMGRTLPLNIELVKATMLPSGAISSFSLRQWVDTESANQIIAATDRGRTKPEDEYAYTEISFDAANLTIERCDTGDEVRLELPVIASRQQTQWALKWSEPIDRILG